MQRAVVFKLFCAAATWATMEEIRPSCALSRLSAAVPIAITERGGKKAFRNCFKKYNAKKIVVLVLRVHFFRLLLFSEEFVFTETGDGD